MKRAASRRRTGGDGANRQFGDQARIPARRAARRSTHCSSTGARCATRARCGLEPAGLPTDTDAASGAAAAMLGFLMMGVATLVGAWLGASYDGTVYPLTLTIAAFGLASLLIALTLVRRDGDVSMHG
jgi:hypothetical protein